MRTHDLFAWIQERHAIWKRRFVQNQPKPWTKDPILQQYRFCNVYRELDTVTQWIKSNWRQPNAENPHVWFSMVVARLVNWPDTLQEVGFPIPFDVKYVDKFIDTLADRKKRGEKVFTGAYMVRADATYDGSKAVYLAKSVLLPLWIARDRVVPCLGDTLAEFHERLTKFRDMGSFMAAQVIADTKYTGGLMQAKDWWTWAASGPGSRRGMARVCNLPLEYRWKEAEWLEKNQGLQKALDPLVLKAGMEPLHGQDVQNCLCEFDKYERVRTGEGRPRSLYAGV